MSLTDEVTVKLRRMVARSWPNFRDKDDLLQEALIGAWQAREGYEMLAARRQCIDYLRHWNPRSRSGQYARLLPLPPALKDAADIEGDLIRRESIERLRRAVDGLPAHVRPYAVAALEGRDTNQALREISQSAGYSESNGWYLRRKATDELRKALVSA